ncbi:acyltransferase, partial [Vibrio parahaemolyticus]|nr:acyltransferase [Vibrio parahaemolyticus]
IAIFKILLPTAQLKSKWTEAANKVMWIWATVNAVILALSNRVEWDVQGIENLKKDGLYLLIINHLSWTDIVVLCCVFK